ncbi:hypothetical protein HPP92_029038 [Vanilla planifolia]|uniref:Uncharacterized protein n=1 Tax=Vanilla planifolia TaxID=51239 RepID=A0A835U239_VANPL|nr:hypothetical protein HPP92_029038 [Vanilla planifolia]KAG0446055.1 hypothetical protein HPP92_029026 [Vanilla planifolia]
MFPFVARRPLAPFSNRKASLSAGMLVTFLTNFMSFPISALPAHSSAPSRFLPACRLYHLTLYTAERFDLHSGGVRIASSPRRFRSAWPADHHPAPSPTLSRTTLFAAHRHSIVPSVVHLPVTDIVLQSVAPSPGLTLPPTFPDASCT